MDRATAGGGAEGETIRQEPVQIRLKQNFRGQPAQKAPKLSKGAKWSETVFPTTAVSWEAALGGFMGASGSKPCLPPRTAGGGAGKQRCQGLQKQMVRNCVSRHHLGPPASDRLQQPRAISDHARNTSTICGGRGYV